MRQLGQDPIASDRPIRQVTLGTVQDVAAIKQYGRQDRAQAQEERPESREA